MRSYCSACIGFAPSSRSSIRQTATPRQSSCSATTGSPRRGSSPSPPRSPKKSTAPSSNASASSITPFWTEFRRQVGRLEGLRGIPLPPDLKYNAEPSLNVTVRTGAFHSDRLRFGRFILLTVHDKAILLAALHPTLYSPIPSLLFEIASLGSSAWMVSFDFPPLTAQAPTLHESILVSKLEQIRREYSPLAVKIGRLRGAKGDVRQQGGLSSSFCILSSAEAAAAGSEFQNESLGGSPFNAFKSALSAHLDSLVMVPLNGSPSSVASIATGHAALANRLQKESQFLGVEALESAFGASWIERLRALVLDDSYGLPSQAEIVAALGKEARKSVASQEFIYFDLRQLDIE